MKSAIGIERLAAQRIVGSRFSRPEEVVAWLGAMQAQDYGASKWAVGVRMNAEAAATDAIVERAIDRGAIVRTHAFRGTWQLIAAADVRWILALVGSQILARCAGRHRQLALDAAVFKKSNAAIAKALGGGGVELTREEMKSALERAKISPEGQRFAHLMLRAELDGLICNGARRGKEATYALLDDRVPVRRRAIDRAEAIAELATRYFQSRAPATVEDFSWWSGLSLREARAGFEAVPRVGVEKQRAAVVLLPAFDEFLIAYRDRDAVLDAKFAKRVNAGGGMFQPLVVIGGRVVGTWRRTIERRCWVIEIECFEGAIAPRVLVPAARRFGEFVGLTGACSVHTSDGGRSVMLRILL